MTVTPPAVPSSSTLTPPGSYQNTAAGQQRPTLTNIHIRSVDDAKKLFYAVQLGMLPKIERRLDAQERRMLRPGNVYVWEEKGPSAGENGYQVCIERWTEGLSWSASRIRDDFLMYYENRKKKSDKDSDGGGGGTSGRARSLENEVLREGERDLYVKQTYSVHRNDVQSDDALSSVAEKDDVKGGVISGVTAVTGAQEKKEKEKRKPRKWHLNAYFTKSTEGNLNSIDSIPFLRDLVVPEGIFSSARQTKKSTSSGSSSNPKSDPSSSTPTSGSGTTTVNGDVNGGDNPNGSGGGAARKRGREGVSVQRTYAPFPVGERGLKPAPPPPSALAPVPSQSNVPTLRNQPPPPPPPGPQWHSNAYAQQDTIVFDQHRASGSFGGFVPPPPPQYAQPQPHPQSPHPSQSLYGTNSFVSSPISPYAPSSASQSSFDFVGAAYGYAGPAQTFGGGMHPNSNSQQQQQHVHHQQQQQQSQFTTGRHHETSPLGSDSPVLSEFGSGGSGSGGSGASGASTSWHTPSPRPDIGLGGGMSLLGGGVGMGGIDGGGGEEDLSGYMPMPPLRYSPDANLDLSSSSPSHNSSSTSLAHANDDMRMMSLGDTSMGRYSHGHSRSRSHNGNNLTFVATTINPDFLTGGGSLIPSLAHHETTTTATMATTTRRDRSRSTSSNPPFRRRPIQLPQLNAPTTDLSTGGAYVYTESDPSGNGSAYDWELEECGGDGGSTSGNGSGSGGGAQRVALAPLHSLQRNHPYRRNPLDDRQLRMLGPGAR